MKILEYNDKKIYFEPTSKFKTVLIGVIFSNELKVEDLAKRALLAKVMKKKQKISSNKLYFIYKISMMEVFFIYWRRLVSSMCFY